MHFHEERLDDVLLHPFRLPEDALGVKVEMEMAGFDDAHGSGFFEGLAFGSLAVREASLGCAFGKGPLAAAICVD